MEKLEIQRFEYPENEKSSLDEIKTIFHNYLRALFGEKMKFKTQVKTKVLSSFLIKVFCNRMIYMPICFHNLTISMVWDCM